jgi:hypothetical protein
VPKRALNGLLEIRASQLRVCGEKSQQVNQAAPKETPPLGAETLRLSGGSSEIDRCQVSRVLESCGRIECPASRLIAAPSSAPEHRGSALASWLERACEAAGSLAGCLHNQGSSKV